MWIYFVSVAVSFTSVFLKGFQHKNVIGNHKKSVFGTSFVMAAFDYLAVTIIVTGGWWIMLTSGIGAAFGMIASMTLHDRLFKPKEPMRVMKHQWPWKQQLPYSIEEPGHRITVTAAGTHHRFWRLRHEGMIAFDHRVRSKVSPELADRIMRKHIFNVIPLRDR